MGDHYTWRKRRDPRFAALRRAVFAEHAYVPHPHQVRLHESPARWRVNAAGAKGGKTTSAAMEGLLGLHLPDSRGWVVGPTYQLGRPIFNQLYWRLAFKSRELVDRGRTSWSKGVIYTTLGSEVRLMSAEDPEKSLLGESLDWLAVDEAALVRAEAWYAMLRGRLVDREGWALLIGTPKGRNWYWDEYRKGLEGRRNYASFHWPTAGNPHINPEEVEDARQNLPEKWFRQEFLGEFVTAEGSVFHWARTLAGTSGLGPPREGVRYFAGADLAKHRTWFVLVVGDEAGNVVHVDRFQKVPWPVAEERVLAACRRYNDAGLLFDATGVGDPVGDHLALKAGNVEVRGYKLTHQSRRELLDNLAVMGERAAQGEGGLAYPDHPALVNELEAFEWQDTRGGGSPRAPPGKFDDCVIALALYAWQIRPSRREPWAADEEAREWPDDL